MRAFVMFEQFRFVVILLAGMAAMQASIASEIPTKSGQVRYTTGTAAVRSEQVGPRRDVISEPVASQGAGPWRVASVDTSVRAGQSSMIAIKPATFELPTSAAFGTGVVASDRGPVTRTAEATRNKEPGFWAPALSTLALALFFFLRRLA